MSEPSSLALRVFQQGGFRCCTAEDFEFWVEGGAAPIPDARVSTPKEKWLAGEFCRQCLPDDRLKFALEGKCVWAERHPLNETAGAVRLRRWRFKQQLEAMKVELESQPASS